MSYEHKLKRSSEEKVCFAFFLAFILRSLIFGNRPPKTMFARTLTVVFKDIITF